MSIAGVRVQVASFPGSTAQLFLHVVKNLGSRACMGTRLGFMYVHQVSAS